MGFLFLTSAEKENGFSFSEQVQKKMAPLLDVYKQIVQPLYTFWIPCGKQNWKWKCGKRIHSCPTFGFSVRKTTNFAPSSAHVCMKIPVIGQKASFRPEHTIFLSVKFFFDFREIVKKTTISWKVPLKFFFIFPCLLLKARQMVAIANYNRYLMHKLVK